MIAFRIDEGHNFCPGFILWYRKNRGENVVYFFGGFGI